MNYQSLIDQIQDAQLISPVQEYKFHPVRRWRFDLCWPVNKVALEIEGGVWVKGRHTRPSGFIADMEKYNTAALLGYRVFRITPQQIKDGSAIKLIQEIFKIENE